MYKVTVQVDVDVLIAIREAAEQSRQAMRREAGKVARGATAQKIIVALAREPGPAKHPVLWESARQRRYVIAKLRREGNLPYRRSHRMAQGWRVVLEELSGDQGGFISIQNSARGAEYVSGELQSRQHAATGWPLARLVIRENEAALQDELISAWYRVVKT